MTKTVLNCTAHPEETLTNYCCIWNCLEALCPECIDAHNKQHRCKGEFPEIDTLHRVQMMCGAKLDCLLAKLRQFLSRLQNAVSIDFEQLIGKSLSELEHQRASLVDNINAFFHQLKDDFGTGVRGRVLPHSGTEALKERIARIAEEVESLRCNLDTPRMLDAIGGALRIDADKIEQSFSGQVAEMLSRCVALPVQVVLHDDNFAHLLAELRRSITVEKRELRVVVREQPVRGLPTRDEQLDRVQREWFENKIAAPHA